MCGAAISAAAASAAVTWDSHRFAAAAGIRCNQLKSLQASVRMPGVPMRKFVDRARND